MRILSDSNVTKSDLTLIDKKQDRQIRTLRIALITSTLFNALLAIGLKFFA